MIKKFDNKFSIKEAFLLFLSLFMIGVEFELIKYLLDVYCFMIPYEINWEMQIELGLIVVIAATIVLYSVSCCKYRIIGDRLYVQEKLLFFTFMEMSIPIDTIDEIKITRSFNLPRKHIQLRAADAAYNLSCSTYRDELYKELVSRMNRQETSSKINFYKQKKS